MSTFSYIVAIFVSLLMHGIIVFLMSHVWDKKAPEIEVRRPTVVQATLVELEAKAPPKAEQTQVIDLAAQRRRDAEARAKAEAERQREARRKRDEEERKRQQEEREKREREAEERLAREQDEVRRHEALEEQRRREFEEALAEEEGYEASVASYELVAGVTALIGQQVEDQWSAPPSARRDMVAILRITMVPTGRLVQVDVIEGSGDAAFDRSVVQAVRKAEPFEMVKTLDSAVFENNFRTFQFRFNPKNLRL